MFNPEDHVAKASITEAKIFGGDIKLGPHGQRCICGGMWQVPGACDLEGAGVGFPFRVLSIYGP